MHDFASPSLKTTTTVVIPIKRNINGPEFASSNFEKSITENYPLGRSILRVAANDADGVREKALFTYFTIHSCVYLDIYFFSTFILEFIGIPIYSVYFATACYMNSFLKSQSKIK